MPATGSSFSAPSLESTCRVRLQIRFEKISMRTFNQAEETGKPNPTSEDCAHNPPDTHDQDSLILPSALVSVVKWGIL